MNVESILMIITYFIGTLAVTAVFFAITKALWRWIFSVDEFLEIARELKRMRVEQLKDQLGDKFEEKPDSRKMKEKFPELH